MENREKFIKDLAEGLRASTELDTEIALGGPPSPTWLAEGQNYLLSESAIYYGKISGMVHAVEILYGREEADAVYREAGEQAIQKAINDFEGTYGDAFGDLLRMFADSLPMTEVTDKVTKPTRPNWLNDETN